MPYDKPTLKLDELNQIDRERLEKARQVIVEITQRGGFKIVESSEQANRRREASNLVARIVGAQAVGELDLLTQLGMSQEEAMTALGISDVDVAVETDSPQYPLKLTVNR